MLERDSVMTCLPARPRSSAALGRGLAQEGRQAGEIGFAVENERVGLLVGEHVLRELRAEAREPLGDGGEPHLRLGLEPRAGAHEDRVVAFERRAPVRASGRGRAARA